MADTISDMLPNSTYSPTLGGFWRRLAAFVIDLVILGIAAIFLYIPLSALFGDKVRIDGLYKSGRCDTGIPNKRDGTPFDISKWTRVLICKHRAYGLIKSRYAVFHKVENVKPNTIKFHTRKIWLDKRNNEITTYTLDSLIFFLFPLYFALFESGKSQRSTGKKIMSLKVETLDGKAISFGLALKRNLFKFIPEIVTLCIGAYAYYTFRPVDLEIGGKIPPFPNWYIFAAAIISLIVLEVWFRILPWFSKKHHRRMPQDRWTDTQVIEWWDTIPGKQK